MSQLMGGREGPLAAPCSLVLYINQKVAKLQLSCVKISKMPPLGRLLFWKLAEGICSQSATRASLRSDINVGHSQLTLFNWVNVSAMSSQVLSQQRTDFVH